MNTVGILPIFFYGTLKQGFYNHTRFGLHLPDNGRVVGPATVDGFALAVDGLPYAVPKPGYLLKGELYQPANELLVARLTAMEEGAGYTPITTDAVMGDGSRLQCMMYAFFHDVGISNLVDEYVG